MWELPDNNDQSAENKPSVLTPWLTLVGAVVVVLAVLSTFSGRAPSSSRAIGRELSRLDLVAVNDRSAIHLPDLKGQVVLVNYWGPWCHFCLEEMPHLNALYQARRDRKDFRLLSVTCAPPGDPETPQLIEQSNQYLRQNNVDFTLFIDPQASSRQALADLDRQGESGYPTTIILDRQGLVRGVWVGFKRGFETEMSQLIDQLLKSK